MNSKLIFSAVRKNAPSILSWMAVGGVALTGVLAHKAGMEYDPDKPLKNQIKHYIPSFIAVAGTMACVIGANCAHMKIEHALAGAVAYYKAVSESQDDVGEDIKLTDGYSARKEKNLSAAMLREDVEIEVYEPYTKQYFKTNLKELLWAELEANKMLSAHGTVKLNDVLALYKNCKRKPIGETIGWSWDEDWFNECASYYWHGGWIDLCPQWEERNGKQRFVLDYGINPMDIRTS